MPRVRVVAYREADGRVPLLAWLDQLTSKARAKCIVRVERLAECGHELRRPETDYLRDGIYELRAKHQGMNYRMLYFFLGRGTAVLTHGFAKPQSRLPRREVELAIRRKRGLERKPEEHVFDWSE